MAEEHKCHAPEGHRLCSNNCGFFGSPATMNMCSKCYRDVRLKEEQQASIKTTVENSLSASSSSSSTSPKAIISLTVPIPPVPVLTFQEVASDVHTPDVTLAQPNRCSVCRKRVGLTGFLCKCGTTFCGVHRYPEKHACTFDFKKIGREEIAKANPVVKGEKLEKI